MKTLKEYLNNFGLFDENKSWVFTIVKPGFSQYSQQIIDKFVENGWRVAKTKSKQLLLKEACKLYEIRKNEDFYKDLCKYMSSGISTAILYTKDEPMTDKLFKEVDKIKDEIRDEYGESDMRNVMHSSDSLEHMKFEASIYF